LSLARLGRVQALKLPADPKPTPAVATAFAKRETVQLVERLIAIGERNRIDPFLLRLAEVAQDPQIAALAAATAQQQGRLDLAALIGRRTLRDSGTLLVEANYPILPIESSGPELALVHGLIRQESNFMVDVVSRAGAKGLMQLLPSTAKETANKIGVPYHEPRLTQDIGYNTLLGQAYLARVLDGFNGGYVLALAGYNAGPGRVRQWIAARGDPRQEGVDLVDWIEAIPFAETRGYVQRVLEATVIYRLRLPQAPPSTAARDLASLGPSWCLVSCPTRVAMDAPNVSD
jgi:soluble lytic murein transglycosylase